MQAGHLIFILISHQLKQGPRNGKSKAQSSRNLSLLHPHGLDDKLRVLPRIAAVLVQDEVRHPRIQDKPQSPILDRMVSKNLFTVFDGNAPLSSELCQGQLRWIRAGPLVGLDGLSQLLPMQVEEAPHLECGRLILPDPDLLNGFFKRAGPDREKPGLVRNAQKDVRAPLLISQQPVPQLTDIHEDIAFGLGKEIHLLDLSLSTAVT